MDIKGITYSERGSIDLVIEHAKRMRLIILSSAGFLALPDLSTVSNKRHDFRGEKLLSTKRVF